MRERTHRPYWSVPSGYSAQGAKKDCVITTSSGSLGAAKKPKKQNRITKAGKLTVAVENGAVRVSESDCPNQDCVHSGAISRAGQSIVCLPARVAVTLEGAASDYDLIAG